MAVEIVASKEFPGVEIGNAPGDGYVVGFTPASALADRSHLFVDGNHPAHLVGMKYFHHPREHSPEAGSRPPDKTMPARTMTMLVSDGEWEQRVWNEETGDSVTVRLRQPGDFIAWEPELWHVRCAIRASTMLTLRWRPIAHTKGNTDVGEIG